MGDAMPTASTLAEEGNADADADAREGEDLHGNNEEKAQGISDDQQGISGDDIEEQKTGGDGAGEEEEEPGECGFCLFMKSGPCRDSFINWEQCIEQAEKDKEDMVEKCHKVTFMLKECMERSSDYYEPVLQAEKAMGEAALEEEEEEAAAAAAAPQDDANSNPPDLQVHLQSENQPSLDAAPHSQVPGHEDIDEEHCIRTDEQHTQAPSEEHHVHTSLDAPAEALHPPDSDAAAQDRPSA